MQIVLGLFQNIVGLCQLFSQTCVILELKPLEYCNILAIVDFAAFENIFLRNCGSNYRIHFDVATIVTGKVDLSNNCNYCALIWDVVQYSLINILTNELRKHFHSL